MMAPVNSTPHGSSTIVMKTDTLTILLAIIAVLVFFAILAGPPAYIAYTMVYPYYVWEIMQGFWSILIFGFVFIIFHRKYM